MNYFTLKHALEEHGELHVYVEDLGEMELRLGQTEFHRDDNMFSVYDGNTRHYIDLDHVIGFYKPMQVFHE